jgi:hypothetical protein
VVLPEELCARLSLLAELETRTVSNMAKVLIQQGVERLEAELQRQVSVGPGYRAEPILSAPPASTPPAAKGAAAAADQFRAELERHEARQPRRLRGLPRRLRLPPSGG